MIKIINQLDAGKHTVLFLNAALPQKNFKKIEIDGREYQPEVVYDMPNALAVSEKETFVGKAINFI